MSGLDIDTYGHQLKGQQSRIGNQISDGAFEAMMEAIQTDRTPNFYFMQYELATWRVKNLLLVPSFAFPRSAIIKRKPLSSAARRAGWVGCNIALNRVPAEARIAVVTTILSLPQSSAGVSPAPPSNSSEGRRDACATLSRGESVVIASPDEVREKFRRVKPRKLSGLDAGCFEHRAAAAIESRRRGNESQIENREKFETPHVVSYNRVHKRGRLRLRPRVGKTPSRQPRK